LRKTWITAAVSGILLLFAQGLIPHLNPGFPERSSTLIPLAAILPALFSFPVGWVSDDPAQAYLAFVSCSGFLLFIQGVWRGSDLGSFMGTLIAAVLLFPATVFGIGFASAAKSIRSNGFTLTWPSRPTSILLAFLLLPAFAVIRYTQSVERRNLHLSTAQITVTESQLKPVRDRALVSEKMHKKSAAHYLAGMLLFQKQRFIEASREWKTSVSLDPGNTDAHAALDRLGMDGRK
jgi:hypothetical protein